MWQCDRLTAISSMSEGDETAKLWKVNRTIHELVKDRVGLLFFFNPISLSTLHRALPSQTMRFKWTSRLSDNITPTTLVVLSKFTIQYIHSFQLTRS